MFKAVVKAKILGEKSFCIRRNLKVTFENNNNCIKMNGIIGIKLHSHHTISRYYFFQKRLGYLANT